MASPQAQLPDTLPPELLAAIARGWRVHPLKPHSKLPCLPGWQHRATSDLKQIEAWCREFRDCNWGAVAGPKSGFFAVDVDDPTAMQQLKDKYGPIPEGLCNVTSRGYQLIYKWPDDTEVKPATNRPCDRIDIRGRDSYIVIPPSLHPSGHRYHYSDATLPILPCPAWLLSLCLTPPQAGTQDGQTTPAGAVASCPIGPGRRTHLLVSTAGKLLSQGVPADGIEAALSGLNRTFSPPHPPEKICSIVTDLVKRYPAGDGAKRTGLQLLRGTDITDVDVPWILKDHIPDKTVFGIHGRPGDGKTRIALRIAADLSRGKTPFTGRFCAARNVLILSNEDAPGRISSLFNSMGGDLERLFVENADDAWWLGDLERLELAIEQNSVGFLVVDSLASHSGKTDLNAHADTTRLLVPLRAVAESHCCAVAVIHHLNKLITADHIAKVAGSIGITASFRHNLHVATDPEDSSLRLLVNGKTNLAPPNISSLRFALSPCEWAGTSAASIEDVYSLATETEDRTGKADKWLREALADGEWRDSGRLQQQAKSGFNLSPRSIFRAAERLSVERRKDGFGGRASWRLPMSANVDGRLGTHGDGTHGNNGDSQDLQAEQAHACHFPKGWHSWENECGGLLQ
jgi:hypothetical protein